MGLIKTAMLTGGGLYAINKITKSQNSNNQQHQQQQQQPQPQYPQQQNYPQQRPNSGPPPFPSSPPQNNRGISNDGSQPKEYWYLNNDGVWTSVSATEQMNAPQSRPGFGEKGGISPPAYGRSDYESSYAKR